MGAGTHEDHCWDIRCIFNSNIPAMSFISKFATLIAVLASTHCYGQTTAPRSEVIAIFGQCQQWINSGHFAPADSLLTLHSGRAATLDSMHVVCALEWGRREYKLHGELAAIPRFRYGAALGMANGQDSLAAECLIARSICVFHGGGFGEAQQCAISAQSYYRQANAAASPRFWRAKKIAAAAAMRLGNYDVAEAEFLAVLDAQAGQRNRQFASTSGNLGALYTEIGYDTLALQHLRTSLAIYQEIGTDPWDHRAATMNIGEAFIATGQHDSARYYYDQLSHLYATSRRAKPQNVGMHHLNLAAYYRGQKDWPEAFLQLDRAWQEYQSIYKAGHSQITRALSEYGQTYLESEQLDSARVYFQRAIHNHASSANFAGDHLAAIPQYLNTLLLASRADLLAAEQDELAVDIAIRLEEVIEQFDRFRTQFSGTTSNRVWVEQLDEQKGPALACALAAYNATLDDAYLELAFELAEASRATTLWENSERFSLMEQSGRLLELVSRGTRYQKELRIFQRKQGLQSMADGGADEMAEEAKLLRSADTVKLDIAREFPAYFQQRYLTTSISVSEVRAQLPDRATALLQYVLSDTTLFIGVVTNQSLHWTAVAVDAQFQNHIAGFANQLEAGCAEQDEAVCLQRYTEVAGPLYSQLIQPVSHLLTTEGIRHLIVVPDGPLWSVPFEALIVPDSAAIASNLFKELPYLLHKFSVQYAFSARSFFGSHNPKPLVHPSYAFAPHSFRASQQPSLPNASQEAIHCMQLVGGQCFQGAAATKSQLKQLTATQKELGIVHFATHATCNFEDPLSSTFSMAGDSLPAAMLTGFEIQSMALKCRLAVLSGCATGVGKWRPGAGNQSLAWLFRVSGSECVTMAQWAISDKATKDVVCGFYAGLKKGERKQVALQNSKIDYLKRADMEHAHPHFWAGITNVGSSAPLFVSATPVANTALWTWLICLLAVLLALFFMYQLRKRARWFFKNK